MGYINLPEGAITGPVIVEADFSYQEFETIVVRLKQAVSQLEQKSRSAKSDILPDPNGSSDARPIAPADPDDVMSKAEIILRTQSPTRSRPLEAPSHVKSQSLASNESFAFLGQSEPKPTAVENAWDPPKNATSSTHIKENAWDPPKLPTSSGTLDRSSGSESFQEVPDHQPSSAETSLTDDGWSLVNDPGKEDAVKNRWSEVWKSEAIEHDRGSVTAVTYVPMIEGLPRDSTHGGWLLSASKQLLNLWECSPGRSEAYLQVMHSQMTDNDQTCLASGHGTKMLLAASTDVRSRDLFVTLHSLVSENILAPRGRLPVPPKGNIMPSNKKDVKVVSLHGFGGPLSNTLAANHDSQVSIFSVSPSMSLKTTWTAHDSTVTQIHCSDYGIALFSATRNGSISKWELRAKPRQAADTYGGLHSEVTGLHQISEHRLLATSTDGGVAIWDLRKSKTPAIFSELPSKGGVKTTAVSPEQGLFALATHSGQILTLEVGASSLIYQPVVQSSPLEPVSDLVWNSRNLQLYSTRAASVVIYQC